MTPEFVIDIILKGGPAALALVLFFAWMRSERKRDEAQLKYEQLLKESEQEDKKILERVLEALHNTNASINANTTSAESTKTSLATIMAFLHMHISHEKRMFLPQEKTDV